MTVQSVDGQVVAGDGEMWDYEPTPSSWWASTAGAHFEEVPVSMVRANDSGAQIACLEWSRSVCYRAYAGHLGVERTDNAGATWKVDWEVLPVQQAALVKEYDLYDVDGGAAHPELVETREVAIIGDASEYYVYAANGVDGVSMRSPDGTWDRIGSPGYQEWKSAPALAPLLTPAEYKSQLLTQLVFAMGLLTATLAIGGVVALNSNAPRAARIWWKIGAWASVVAWAALYSSVDGVAEFLADPLPIALPGNAFALSLSVVCSLIMALAMFTASPNKGFAGIAASIGLAVVAASCANALNVNFRTQVLAGLLLSLVLATATAIVFFRWLKRSPEPPQPPRSR